MAQDTEYAVRLTAAGLVELVETLVTKQDAIFASL